MDAGLHSSLDAFKQPPQDMPLAVSLTVRRHHGMRNAHQGIIFGIVTNYYRFYLRGAMRHGMMQTPVAVGTWLMLKGLPDLVSW